ncbi:MAG: DMT family transporter [Christensenella sp.]|nr:DMT family transporter [Christensenella sp.]
MEEKKTTRLQNMAVVSVLAIVCCVLWGSAYPGIKIGYQLFGIASGDTASQILFAGLRFALAGVLAILMGSLLRRRFLFPKKTSWGKIAKLSLVQTILQYVFFYIGLAHASAVKSSIINGSSAFIAILVACFLFRQEKFTRAKLFGCLLGFAGIVTINLGGADGAGMSFLGEGFILISTVAYAVSTSLIKNYSQAEDPVVLSGYQFLIGGLVMAAVGAALGGRLPSAGVAGAAVLCYLAFLSAAAYSLWGVLLQHNPVSRVAVFGFVIPICGVFLSALLLGETGQAANPQSIAALVLVCAGIIIINKFGAAKTGRKLR